MAAGIDNGTVHIFDIGNSCQLLHQIPKMQTASDFNSQMSRGVRFLDSNGNCILVGSNEGCIKLYDIRTSGAMSQFTYFLPKSKESVFESICCFDRNASGDIIGVGVKENHEYAKLVFFDIRQNKFLYQFDGVYITEISSMQFHPSNPTQLITGGTNGIIDKFDITHSDIKMALKVIKCHSPIYRLNWYVYFFYIIFHSFIHSLIINY